MRMWAGVSPSPGADVAVLPPAQCGPLVTVRTAQAAGLRTRSLGGYCEYSTRLGGYCEYSTRSLGGYCEYSTHLGGYREYSTRSLGGYREYSTRLQILRRRQRDVLLHGLPKVVRRERLVAHLRTNKQNKHPHTRKTNSQTRTHKRMCVCPRDIAARSFARKAQEGTD